MANIKIYLRNKQLQNNLYPIVLRITKNRKSKVISLGWQCKKEDWDMRNSQFKKSQTNYKSKNATLSKLKVKAWKIIDEFAYEDIDFSLAQFEEKFRGKEKKSITVAEFWLDKINDLNIAGRTGNARAYKDVYDSFFKFQKSKHIKFNEITPEFLDKYETFLRARGNTDGGIGVKMREIRALFNDAIKKGIVDEKYYPFKTYKVSKLKGRGIKKALTRDQVRLIENFETDKYPHLIDAKNFFVFSYYTGGMNFMDMLKLKWDNIHESRIQYIRSKTKGKFSTNILEPVREILIYYDAQKRPTDFVFPILLKKGMTAKQIENRKLKTLKIYNKQLKEIASILGIKVKITSYTARHSYATNLKQAGVSADIIGESMGHNNVSVTNAYLKEFEDNIIDDAVKKLLEPQQEYKILVSSPQ